MTKKNKPRKIQFKWSSEGLWTITNPRDQAKYASIVSLFLAEKEFEAEDKYPAQKTRLLNLIIGKLSVIVALGTREIKRVK